MWLQLMQESVHIHRMETARLFVFDVDAFATMTLLPYFRPALLCACLGLASGCSKTHAGQDVHDEASNARRNAEASYHRLMALPAECTVGTAVRAVEGNWLTAPKAYPEAGHPYTFVQQFDKATMTSTVHAALNRAGLRTLDKVEIRDARGNWSDAGPVTVHEAPAGCDDVWLQQDLGSPREVAALRFTFRRGSDPMMLANAGVLVSH
jgi:hypothetical protein